MIRRMKPRPPSQVLSKLHEHIAAVAKATDGVDIERIFTLANRAGPLFRFGDMDFLVNLARIVLGDRPIQQVCRPHIVAHQEPNLQAFFDLLGLFFQGKIVEAQARILWRKSRELTNIKRLARAFVPLCKNKR